MDRLSFSSKFSALVHGTHGEEHVWEAELAVSLSGGDRAR